MGFFLAVMLSMFAQSIACLLNSWCCFVDVFIVFLYSDISVFSFMASEFYVIFNRAFITLRLRGKTTLPSFNV